MSREASVFETRHDGIEAADFERSFAPGKGSPAFGMNVDHASGAETELCGERTRDERDAVYYPRWEFLAEPGDAFRQQDIIDAVLQIGVLPAHVELAEGILRDTRKTQNGLVKWSVFALRLLAQAIRPDGVASGSEAGHDLLARNVECLTGHDDAVRCRRSRRTHSDWGKDSATQRSNSAKGSRPARSRE